MEKRGKKRTGGEAGARRGKIFVVLNDVRSAHNVGSVFRTADALAVDKIFLCGYTPAPTDRFGRARSDIAKVGLGAEKSVAWEIVASAEKLIRTNKTARIIAIEQAPQAIHIRKLAEKISTAKKIVPAGAPIRDTFFIFGNETKGLPPRLLALCDDIAFIPMKGKKESLNVSVSVAVALYIALRP